MNNLGVRIEPNKGQLIAIRKVSGEERTGSRFFSVSFLKKYFGVEPDDFVYLTEIRNKEYLLSKIPISETSIPKRILKGSGKTIKIYLTNAFHTKSFYSFFYNENAFYIRPSTIKEIGMRKKTIKTHESGILESNFQGVYIQKKDVPFFKEHKGGFLVSVHRKKYLFIEIEQIKNNDDNIPEMHELSEKEKNVEFFQYYLRNLPQSRVFYIPASFLREAKMKKQEHFLVKRNGEKMLIVPKLQEDELTGELYNPLNTTKKMVTVSKKQKENAECLRHISENTNLSYNGLLREMQMLNARAII